MKKFQVKILHNSEWLLITDNGKDYIDENKLEWLKNNSKSSLCITRIIGGRLCKNSEITSKPNWLTQF